MSIKIVAKFAQELGTPDLLYTMTTMGNIFDQLTAEQQTAYESVFEELMLFVQQQS